MPSPGEFTYENAKADAAAAASAVPGPELEGAPEPEQETAPPAKAAPWAAVNPATEKTAAARPARSTT